MTTEGKLIIVEQKGTYCLLDNEQTRKKECYE